MIFFWLDQIKFWLIRTFCWFEITFFWSEFTKVWSRMAYFNSLCTAFAQVVNRLERLLLQNFGRISLYFGQYNIFLVKHYFLLVRGSGFVRYLLFVGSLT